MRKDKVKSSDRRFRKEKVKSRNRSLRKDTGEVQGQEFDEIIG